jgi:hypothetical protein
VTIVGKGVEADIHVGQVMEVLVPVLISPSIDLHTIFGYADCGESFAEECCIGSAETGIDEFPL